MEKINKSEIEYMKELDVLNRYVNTKKSKLKKLKYKIVES